MLSNMVKSTWKKKGKLCNSFQIVYDVFLLPVCKIAFFFYQNNVVLNLLNSQISYQFMFNLSVFPGRDEKSSLPITADIF